MNQLARAETTPIQAILEVVGGRIVITNGAPNPTFGVVYSSGIRGHDRGPVPGTKVSEGLPILAARLKASRCRNPRDEAVDKNGCLQDHSYEVPGGVDWRGIDDYLFQIAELLYLVGPADVLPTIGIGDGVSFRLDIDHNSFQSYYEATLHLAKGQLECIPSWGDLSDDRLIRANGKTPEAALESCVAVLSWRVSDQLTMAKLTGMLRHQYGDDLDARHPYFLNRPDGTRAVMYRVGDDWFCGVGQASVHALHRAVSGQLTCSHDGGRGCTLKPDHGGSHLPPVEMKKVGSTY